MHTTKYSTPLFVELIRNPPSTYGKWTGHIQDDTYWIYIPEITVIKCKRCFLHRRKVFLTFILSSFTFVCVPAGLSMVVWIPSILMIHLQPSCLSLAAGNRQCVNKTYYKQFRHLWMDGTSRLPERSLHSPKTAGNFRNNGIHIIYEVRTHHGVCLHPLAHVEIIF